MVQYWETKKELFGEGALFCSPKIAISDLDEDAQSSLYDSVFMLLPSRDKHGRRIIFSTRQAWKFASVNSMVRSSMGILCAPQMFWAVHSHSQLTQHAHRVRLCVWVFAAESIVVHNGSAAGGSDITK